MIRTLTLAALLFAPFLLGQEQPQQEPQPNNPSVEQVPEGTETPAKTEPAKNNVDRPDEPAAAKEAAKEAPAKAAKQPKGDQSKESPLSWLPWILAVVMSGFAGAAVAYILVLRKQDRHFSALRQKVIEGKEPVLLLSDEAARLIRDFKGQLVEANNYLKKTIQDNREDLGKLVQEAKDTGQVSRDQTQQTVDTFKSSLNGMLEKITKFMQNVVQNTKETHDQAVATKDYSKQVSELIKEKEAEISKLKEGYHLHLIKPLTNAFLKIRDELYLLKAHSSDAQVKEGLGDLDRQIVAALEDMQIKETVIPDRPETLHSRFWESLGAAEPTDDQAKHGSLSKVHEKGYQCHTANGEPHVVRKAVVVVYSSSSDTTSQESSPSQQSAPASSQSEPIENTPNDTKS